MSRHSQHVSPVFLALILCTLPLRGLAADPLNVDLSLNVAGAVTDFVDAEANYWPTDNVSVGLVVGDYEKGLLQAWDLQDYSGHAFGGRVNWGFSGDCSTSYCWAVSARYLHIGRLQESDLSLPSNTTVDYSTNNYFIGFGGMWTHSRLILKFFVGPDYWSNPKNIPAPQSSNASKTIEAVNHGLGMHAEVLVGVRF